MSTFLSYASADRKVAERLRDELGKAGIQVWSDTDTTAGEKWRQRIEDAIKSASEILVLIGPKNGDDPGQQFTWQVALETVWQDPGKRLIPILLPGATPPPFIYSAAPSRQPSFIRLDDPNKLKDIASEIAKTVQRGHWEHERHGRKTVPRIREDDERGTGDVTAPETIGADTNYRADRATRLSEIREYVEQLRARPTES